MLLLIHSYCFHHMEVCLWSAQSDLLPPAAHPVSSSKGQSEEEEASGEKGEQDPEGWAGQRHLLPPPVRQPVGGRRGQGQP